MLKKAQEKRQLFMDNYQFILALLSDLQPLTDVAAIILMLLIFSTVRRRLRKVAKYKAVRYHRNELN
jgi:hypothetical protein